MTDDKSFKKVKLRKEWNHCLPNNNLVLLVTRLPTEATSKGLSSGNGLFPMKESDQKAIIMIYDLLYHITLLSHKKKLESTFESYN